MDLKKIVSESLKGIMEFHNVDLAEFARACNMPEKRVKALVDGKGVMTMQELITVTHVFNVSADYLLGFYPYPLPAPHTEEEQKVYAKIATMDKEEMKKFIEKLGR